MPRPLNVLALCWKNAVNIYRNLLLLFVQFLLPTIQVVFFCLAVGRNLEGVTVAYVNTDVGPGMVTIYDMHSLEANPSPPTETALKK